MSYRDWLLQWRKFLLEYINKALFDNWKANSWKKWRVGRKIYRRIETRVLTSFCSLRYLLSFSLVCILKSRLSTNMFTNVNVIQLLIAHNKLHVKDSYKDCKCVRFKQIYSALNRALCFIINWLRFQNSTIRVFTLFPL